jgi:phage major head subunit gpT-like protein
MPIPAGTQNWSALLEPGLRAAWRLQMDAEVGGPGVSQLFNFVNSTKNKEYTVGVGGMSDVPVYNGAVEYDAFDQQYLATFTHEEYAKGIAIERKLVDDDLYNVINQNASMLGVTFGRTRRKAMASIFNNGFVTTQYTTPDAVAMFSASHVTSKQNAGTQSNTGVLPLTYDNLMTTYKAMMVWTDDRGELMTINPDTIVVPVGLADTAWVLANSMQKPGTANNDMNYNQYVGWNVIVDRYLTDTNNWFVVDSTMAKMHLWWFDRVLPEFVADPNSDYNLVSKYRGYMRYSFGPDDWRWAYGHNVP